jgi:hypothetical protein
MSATVDEELMIIFGRQSIWGLFARRSRRVARANVARRGHGRSFRLRQKPLFLKGFLGQVFLPGSVDADCFALSDEQWNHDLKAGFELRLL